MTKLKLITIIIEKCSLYIIIIHRVISVFKNFLLVLTEVLVNYKCTNAFKLNIKCESLFPNNKNNMPYREEVWHHHFRGA